MKNILHGKFSVSQSGNVCYKICFFSIMKITPSIWNYYNTRLLDKKCENSDNF